MRHMCVGAVAAAWLGLAGACAAQELADRVAGAPDGVVRMTYATRPGVCGDGRNINTHRGDWVDCESGPARVVLTKENGEVVRLRTYVGGRWRDRDGRVTDLGRVAASDAAEYLLSLVEEADDAVSRRAVLPAVIADSAVAWPRLLAVAADHDRGSKTRRQALQWVGIEASRALDAEAEMSQASDEDSEARERAVFSISQLPDDQSIPRLIEIAQTHRYAHVRQKALFWLAQSGDERAVEVLEVVLRRAER